MHFNVQYNVAQTVYFYDIKMLRSYNTWAWVCKINNLPTKY